MRVYLLAQGEIRADFPTLFGSELAYNLRDSSMDEDIRHRALGTKWSAPRLMQPREVQNCSFLGAQTPKFPSASGRLGNRRVSLWDAPLAHEGPKTGQGRLGGPSRRSKRAQSRRKIALRRPRWPPDGPRRLQDAPRGLQEASQEGPKKQK